jgi:hypothetical protein
LQNNSIRDRVVVEKWFSIMDASLFKQDKQLYSRYADSAFVVNVSNPFGTGSIDYVTLSLDTGVGDSVNVTYNKTRDEFYKSHDPNFYVALTGACNVQTPSFDLMRVAFRIYFNFTWPNENLLKITATAANRHGDFDTMTVFNAFQVETDLVFSGDLEVTGEYQGKINDGDPVLPGENLTFTKVMVIYEDSDNVCPPNNVFDVTLWAKNGDSWTHMDSSGTFVLIEAEVGTANDEDYYFVLNITSIPPEADHSDVNFSVVIDGEGVMFSDPTPSDTVWHPRKDIDVSVNITDGGGGVIKANSIQYRLQKNEEEWSSWSAAGMTGNAPMIVANAVVNLNDGGDNRIQWRATDTVGNPVGEGWNESPEYVIKVDTLVPEFADPWPSESQVQKTTNVTIGINITDLHSGIDGATVSYTVSTDDGQTWSSWTGVGLSGISQDLAVNTTVEVINGSTNLVKWRATDAIGNGPAISDGYRIVVDTTPVIENREPVIDDIPDSETTVGQLFTLQVTASDPDGDELTYSIQQRVGDLTIDSDGIITYNPGMGEVGVHNITVRVSDGEFTVSRTFQLTVKTIGPTVTIDNPGAGPFKGTITITGTATGGSQSISKVWVKVDNGDWIQADGTTSWSFTINTKDLANGDHKVYAKSNDGSTDSSTKEITITVDNPKNGGNGGNGDGGMDFMLILAVIIIVVIVVIVAVALAMKGRSKTPPAPPPEQGQQPPPQPQEQPPAQPQQPPRQPQEQPPAQPQEESPAQPQEESPAQPPLTPPQPSQQPEPQPAPQQPPASTDEKPPQ